MFEHHVHFMSHDLNLVWDTCREIACLVLFSICSVLNTCFTGSLKIFCRLMWPFILFIGALTIETKLRDKNKGKYKMKAYTACMNIYTEYQLRGSQTNT